MFDALFATGCSVSALGMLAYKSPNERFLYWGGALSVGLGAMVGVSLLSVFSPGNPALQNIWLYGGTLLFGGYVLYDTSVILHAAKY